MARKQIVTKFLPSTREILQNSSVFLANPQTISEDDAVVTTDEEGNKMIKTGTVYPSNDANARGIIYGDFYFDFGDVNVPVMYEATVLEGELPVPVSAEAKAVLPRITFIPEARKIPNTVFK